MDHSYVFWFMFIRNLIKTTYKQLNSQKIKAIVENSYILDFEEIVKNASYDDTLDTSVDYHDKMLTALLNKHAPVQHKQVVEHPTYPWYTPQILEQKSRL